MNPKLQKLINEYRFRFSDGIGFALTQTGVRWNLSRNGPFYDCPFKLMDGTKAGGTFDTFEKAEAELLRVCEYYNKELTPREIRHWFSERWIRREEKPEALRAFKNALLDKRYKDAARIYNKEFSSWERECVPDKVHYQCCINL
jgi:hypothetical protein